MTLGKRSLIVIINVPLPVGRPKIFSIATYVALKWAPSPKVLEAAWAERASSHLPCVDRIYRS